MKYICLGYMEPGKFEGMTEDEQHAIFDECFEFNDRLRAGRAFSYTTNGPKGLVTGKRAVLALASGGVFSNGPATPFDFHEPYLRAILGFIGIPDVDVVRVEGYSP